MTNPKHSVPGLWAISLALFLLAATAGCGREESGGPAVASPRVVSQSEAVALMKSDAPPLILDVRTPAEYESGHVPGALLIPHNELPEHLEPVLANRDRLVIVYCETGRRAAKAIDVLQKAGLEHVAELEGDMKAWRDAGLPQDH